MDGNIIPKSLAVICTVLVLSFATILIYFAIDEIDVGYCNRLSILFDRNKVCYHDDGIGCFSNACPFDNANRELPESPRQIQIEYLLYTRVNKTSPQLLTPEPTSIQQSHFNGTLRTKFIIHGFADNAHEGWLRTMTHAILNEEDVNVILVNWEKGADNVNYFQAAANTRVVGALVAKLIGALNTTAHAQFGDIHLIGHSLGSHIAGYVGDRLNKTVGRITGLDPAGPCFEDKSPRVRLDASDALFVDAIHTDGDSLLELGFGLMQPVADADFYPNGGTDQPGCDHELGKHLFSLITLKLEDFAADIACSHCRARDLFTESIISSCRFTAYHCDSDSNFEDGRCNKCRPECARMGYHADPGSRGTFYLKTNGQDPYCVG